MFTQMESLGEFYEPTGNCSAGFAENCSLLEQAQPTNDTYPESLRFNEYLLTLALVYTALFLVAAIGNLTVFISLFRSRRRKSRISLMIRHLAIADLLVTFINIPLEVGWRVTVQWIAGNLACKTFQFLRAFSLYLSSNVLVCVSLDRYFAVLHPLRVNDARRRGKMMLACAWSLSLICAIPQSIVFHVSTHPLYPSFLQCVTFGFFSSGRQEIVYNLLCVSAMYFVPLIVIIVAYTCILCEITHKSRDTGGETYQTSSGRMRLRRSDISNIERAKSRTLKMTVTIVLVFVWCWTPYVVMTLWYMFDRASAEKLPNWLQDALFMMAVSNSCMNPLVYGSFAINFRREFCKCLVCFGCSTTQPTLTRKSTDEATQAAGQGSGLARRLIKCVMTLRKVGSGATRSTVMVPAVNNVSSAQRTVPVHSPKDSTRLARRPPSVGHISFLSEPLPNRGFRSSFHSEPCTYPEDHKAETSSATSHSSNAKVI